MREDGIPVFTPPNWTLKELRDAVPSHLFERSKARACAYLLRDISMASILCFFTRILSLFCGSLPPIYAAISRTVLWSTYWWFQGLIFTGIWTIGHECGHGAFSKHQSFNDVIGFAVHTFLLTPYYSWKIIHHRHHINHGSMERDEVYVPKTRSQLGIPEETETSELDYHEIFGDTPVYTLYVLVRQQLLAFPVYLMMNVSGQSRYPRWTNHFNHNSIFFKTSQRLYVMISNIGVVTMLLLLWETTRAFSPTTVFCYYGIPYMLVNHWIVMITYLQHTDPQVPHYRNGAWTFPRGAAATVDRNFLGWQGRFFLHDVGHFHVVHHFFPKLPWYNGEAATACLKKKLGTHYCHREGSSFKALWDNYNSCQFVEDTGRVLFYKDKNGITACRSR